jgi:hypothetical protein
MVGVCGLITGWVTYLEMNHEHHGPPEDRAYKKVRGQKQASTHTRTQKTCMELA